MFSELLQNISRGKKVIMDLRSIHEGMEFHLENKGFYNRSANSLLHQLRILNNAVPELLKKDFPSKPSERKKDTNVKTNEKKADPLKKSKVSSKVISKVKDKLKEGEENTVKVKHESKGSKKDEKNYVTINKKDKKEFLEKLKLSQEGLSNLERLKKGKKKDEELKPSSYARISNKFFREFSEKISSQFGSLKDDLKKGNVRFLLTTYLSMAIFSIFLSLIVTVLIFGALIVFDFSFISYFWVVFLVPGIVALIFYVYPSSEAGNVQKKITQELPFATIQMAAIAGSDITPVKIFKIISQSPEYPNIGKEIRKIISQIEVYGYDLVTALKNVAGRTSNKKLAELFSGVATNISTGGALKNYLNKKSENFLLDYKLERQKYIDLAGTFMDVYISILIAAPLVLMMMFIVMNVAGLGLAGLTITTLLFLSVGVVIVINIIFLVVLNLKQPKI